MIYALVGSDVDESDREAIAHAISTRNAAVLAQYADRGKIRHILDLSPFDELLDVAFHCIWCLDVIRPSTRNAPVGYQADNPWYFMRATNNECIGQPHRIGSGVYLNPERQGCYVAMGCEQARGRSRRQCRCITNGRTYCQHARNPPRPGGPCV